MDQNQYTETAHQAGMPSDPDTHDQETGDHMPESPTATWLHRLLLVLQAGFVLYCFNYLLGTANLPANKTMGTLVLLLAAAGVWVLLLRRKRFGWMITLVGVSWQLLARAGALLRMQQSGTVNEDTWLTTATVLLLLLWTIVLCSRPIRRLYGVATRAWIITLMVGALLYFLLQVLPVLLFQGRV